jgi:cytochrome c peroxidase
VKFFLNAWPVRVAIDRLSLALLSSLVLSPPPAWSQDADPPEVAVGERLFLETRFAQFFFAHSGGDVNATLVAGDPVMDFTVTTTNLEPGPFAGQSMNCRACHLVDEHNARLGNRTYNDFARRSPVPERGDGRLLTPRNSPPLVNALLARKGPVFLHFDGEFTTPRDLVKGTLTGRNYGWLPQEQTQAVAHIARVIRDDDGNGALAQQYGGAYRIVLAGRDPCIPEDFRLPRKFRVQVDRASDREILDKVAALIEAYMRSLVFAQDERREFSGSPYDVFLRKNGLPRKPRSNESPLNYNRRLLRQINQLANPQFVSDADGSFTTQNQPFQFGDLELAGLKIFLTPGSNSPGARPSGGVGNCVACHTPPAFTDFRFHNTGATQEEYDSIHGPGAFALIQIPDLRERRTNFDAYLPPTARHPGASGRFLAVPSLDRPGWVDLGLWNVFANPDLPKPQANLLNILKGHGRNTYLALLPETIARFKTPGLRDPGQSNPYLHTGRMDSLEAVIEFYRQFSDLARAGQVRNGAPELPGIELTEDDVAPLAAFLRALNEDYE